MVVARGRSRGHQGDVAASTRVFVENKLIVLVCGGIHIESVDSHKSALVRRVAEHTHHQRERIGGGNQSGIERHLQCVHRVNSRINHRQHSYLVIVGAIGGVGVKTQRVGTGLGVRRAVINNRIAGVRGVRAVVDVAPTVGQIGSGH